MGKKRFRIISINQGEKVMYDTKIRTWFGWISFSVFYRTFTLHVFSDPVDSKESAYKRIRHYCEVKGHDPENIAITEVGRN